MDRYATFDTPADTDRLLKNIVMSGFNLLPQFAIALQGMQEYLKGFDMTKSAPANKTVTSSMIGGAPVSDYRASLDYPDRTIEQDIYLDPASGLPVRTDVQIKAKHAIRIEMREDFSDYELTHKTLPTSAFVYTPPAGATLYEPQPQPQ
jgi:hypothetical protein